MVLENSISLLISTCDKFSDLWDANQYFLNLNWANRNIGTFLVTDKETDKKYDDIKIISTGDDDQMPTRINKSLAEINTPYVLLTLDDYFLIKNVDNDAIEEIVNFMDTNNIDYCRLYPINKEKKKYVKSNPYYYSINLKKEYAVNLYPGIWKTDFLKKTFSNDVNAWKYEVSLTKCAIDNNAKCIMYKPKVFEILDVVRKGKVLHKANKYLKRNNVSIGDRPVASWKTEIRYFIFGTFSHLLPNPVKRFVKKIMRKMGFEFYS